jgi:uncharacterized protein (TIGR03435 family)
MRPRAGFGPIALLVLRIIPGVLGAPAIEAQNPTDWQINAGGKMAFEIASVKPSEGAFVPPNVPLNVTAAFTPTGGRFKADAPLWAYIEFAFRISPTEEQRRDMYGHLPGWVMTDRYTVDARAAGNPTKDQMRLMVQALLAERFGFTAHFETHEVSVFALTLAKAGQPGPQLRKHDEGAACYSAGDPAPAQVTRDGLGDKAFPPFCDSFVLLASRGQGRARAGFRNATLDMIAASLADIVGEGRPVIDATGLQGNYDFTMDWALEPNAAPLADGNAAPPEPPGLTPRQALRDQLGLKLEARKAPLPILVIDGVARLSQN